MSFLYFYKFLFIFLQTFFCFYISLSVSDATSFFTVYISLSVSKAMTLNILLAKMRIQSAALNKKRPENCRALYAQDFKNRIATRLSRLLQIDLLYPIFSICFRLYSKIFPSADIVMTCHGITFPLAASALFTAFSIPPQQGTSIRATVILLISFFNKIPASFSA